MRLLPSYPTELFFLVLLVGIPLAFLNPYKAFLFVVFGLSARHLAAAVQTRIFPGPYLNLNDGLILVGVLALYINIVIQGKPLRVPRFLGALFLTLLVSIAIGYFAVGEHDINFIRYSKYSLVFPLLFLLSINFITDSRRARDFFLVLLFGGIVASLHHIILTIQAYSIGMSLLTMRDIGFLLHPGYFLLLSALQERLDSRKVQTMIITSLPIFAASLILDQTRSVWISMVGATVITPFLLRLSFKSVMYRVILLLVMCFFLVLLFSLFFPGSSPFDIVLQRVEQLQLQYVTATSSREVGGEVEWNAWLSGNVFLGRGMGSQADFAHNFLEDNTVAYGHVGYISYLTYTGLIGFIIYAVIMPMEVVKRGVRVYASYQHDSYVRSLVVMAIAGIVLHAIVAVFTSGYISPSNAGLYYGAVIGLSYSVREKEVSKSIKRIAAYY